MRSSHGAENSTRHYRPIPAVRFPPVSPSIEAILQESTIYWRRKRLRKITHGLELKGVCGTTVERMKAQGGDKSRLAIGALMWVSHAERSLTDESCHAPAIESGFRDFNPDNIPSITTLLGCCQGPIIDSLSHLDLSLW